MRNVVAAAVGLSLAVPAAGQNQVSTQFLWGLDSISNTIPIFNPAGAYTGISLPLSGSGAVRGMGFNSAGLCFVARGSEVRTYDGTSSALFADAADGLDQAQDVAVRPNGSGEVWVSAGTNLLNSKIIRFDSAGAVIQTFTAGNMNHPRRIAWNADGTRLYAASVGNRRILSLDAATGTFAEVADLTSANVNPIGLSFDSTRNALWVTGDWGFNGDVGLVALSSGAYTTALGEGQVAGLTAPSNVFFDRFRVLNVCARNQNGGTAGIYRFDASTGNDLINNNLGAVTGSGFQTLIDMRPRPELTGITAPTQGGQYVLNASLTTAVTNPITFTAPLAAGAPYAAAISPRWQTGCAPHVPGIIDPLLRLPGPDARGIPMSLSDGGVLFFGSAGVCCPINTGSPLNTILTVSGFLGMLDGNGVGNASITFLPGSPAVLHMFEVSIAFITVDPNVANGFGLISDPICAVVMVGP